MPHLLYAAEVTPKSVETIVVDQYNFCELSRAVLSWKEASQSAQWLLEVCPGPKRSFFAVCRLTPEQPDAALSCVALHSGALRLTALNAEARAAKDAVAHVTGDLDTSGDQEAFYGVSCTGLQDWKISAEVEFFETFSIVIKTPELLKRQNRAYVQIFHENRWINIAHIPGDRMWVLIKNRLVVRGDKIRCLVVGPDANTAYSWDAVTSIDDLTEKSDDDDNSFLAEAVEVSALEDDTESEEETAPVTRQFDIETIEVDDSDDSSSAVPPSPPKRQRLSKSSPSRTTTAPEPIPAKAPSYEFGLSSSQSQGDKPSTPSRAHAAKKAACKSATAPTPQTAKGSKSSSKGEAAAPEPRPSKLATHSASENAPPKTPAPVKTPIVASVNAPKSVAAGAAPKTPTAAVPKTPVAGATAKTPPPATKTPVAAAAAGVKTPATATKKPLTEEAAVYLRNLEQIVASSGPSRLSALGSRLKKPAGVPKLVDFIRQSGLFEITNTDIVSLIKKK